MREIRVTYDEFIEGFGDLSHRKNPVASVKTVLGRKLTSEDLEQDHVVRLVYTVNFRHSYLVLQRAFLAATLDPLCQECGLSLKRSPLLKHLMTNVPAATFSPDASRASSSVSGNRSRVPEQAKATVITPIVGGVAEQLFNNPFRVVGEPQEAQDVAEEIADVKEHNEDPTSIVWGSPAAKNSNYYTSVRIDGVEYEASSVWYFQQA